MQTTLETMRPTPTFDAAAHADVVDGLAARGDVRYLVWAGDWCPDCRRQLPDFAAALAAAGVGDERIEQYPVERGDDGKTGPRVEEYDIERIPTIVVETPDGTELVRVVEQADAPLATAIAQALSDS